MPNPTKDERDALMESLKHIKPGPPIPDPPSLPVPVLDPTDPAYAAELAANVVLRKIILVSGAARVLASILPEGVYQQIAQYIHDNMVTAKELTDLFAAVTALINTHSSDTTTIANLQQKVTDTAAAVADLSDPALEAQTVALTQAATNAIPSPAPPAANPTP